MKNPIYALIPSAIGALCLYTVLCSVLIETRIGIFGCAMLFFFGLSMAVIGAQLAQISVMKDLKRKPNDIK